MDLIEKSFDLLTQQTAFVAVRIYGTSEFAGTVLLVTEKEVYGSLMDQWLETQLRQSAREVLRRRRSEKKVIASSGGMLNVFFEACLPDETLLIVGAGHIASPLCQMAKMVGFRVVIVDDREDYANDRRFPQADLILVGTFVEILRDFPFNRHTYVVLVTRGHLFDRDCLREILGKPAAYIGMIGSLRRLRGVFRLLEQEGCDREKLAQVHGPIGLPIGAQTPDEIAVSIISEVISIRYQGPEWSLSLKGLHRRKDERPGTLQGDPRLPQSGCGRSFGNRGGN
jgi:xanthine dehydrogenase accessory factor